MIRIPDFFGIDGKALPPDVQSFGAKRRIEPEEGFREILEEELKKLKEKEDL